MIDPPPTQPYVFLSYASVEREQAVMIADRLQSAGIPIWVDRQAIAGGTSWGAEIAAGIEQCSVLMLLCSAAAFASRNVRQEIQLAWKHERAYLPVLLEQVEIPKEAEYFLEGWQWVELLDHSEQQWLPVLLRALARLGVQPAAPVPASAPPPEAAAPAQAPATPEPSPVVLAGRDAELAVLQTALDTAAAGSGRLLLVSGEPGIGKTALCEAVAAQARARGALVLWGRCWEGEGAPAYLPWVEVLRTAVRASDLAQLAPALGASAADLAQLVPELAALLPGLPPLPPADPEAARFRLFDAVVRFLELLSEQQPVLLVLEDLHWADKSSLLLLQWLVRTLPQLSLLVIATYRDTELTRTHSLSEALTSLRRERSVERLSLSGLDEAGVRGMTELLLSQTLSPRGQMLISALRHETDGNPFFVQEIVRNLQETGRLYQQDGRWTTDATSIADFALPEGVREVVGRRLSHLSEQTNRLLTLAAVLGREFDLGVLARLSDAGEDKVDAAIDEAESGQLVAAVGRSNRASFAHALVRETLLEELPERRRARLHLQVAHILEEQFGPRAGEHAVELAEHFAYATDPADLEKAVRYAELAAEQSMAVYAYSEAAHHLTQALEEQELLDPSDKARRCDLLLALGGALLPAGETLRAVEQVAPQALELAEALDDGSRAARACQLACTGLDRYGNLAMLATPLYRRWAERADRYAASGTIERVYADLALGRLRVAQGPLAEALALYTSAVAQARQLGNAEALFEAAVQRIFWSVFNAPPALLERETALQLADEFCSRSRAGVQARTVGLVLGHSGGLYADAGDRTRAEDAWRQLGELAERTREASSLLLGHICEIGRALLDGDLEGSAAAAARLPSYGDEFGMPVTARQMAAAFGFRPLMHLNRLEEAMAGLPKVTAVTGAAAGQERPPLAIRARMALGLACLGRSAEGRALLEQALAELSAGSEDWQTPTQATVLLLEAAVLLGDRDAARRLVPQLAPAASSAVCGGTLTCVARLLGAATALLGEREQAMRYYEQALEVCGRLRFRPELALTHLGIAELLLDEGIGDGVSGVREGMGTSLSLAGEGQSEGVSGSVGARHAVPSTRAEAASHLDIAIAEFQAMKMQPALERALRHKEVLKA